MIKRINISLILIAIIGSIYITITRDDKLVYILKDMSIIFTINVLYIVSKMFNIKINDEVNFIYILFIFLAHFVGVTCEIYNSVYWFDKFTHFLSGIVSSLGAIYILVKIKITNKKFNILFIIAFSMLVASTWEVFEYTSSILFNVDPQRVLLTGVNDTMGDIIVALLGSIIICISYYFEIVLNNNFLIKNFINSIK